MVTFEEKRKGVVELMTNGTTAVIDILKQVLEDLNSNDDELIFARCMYMKALIDYMGNPEGMRAHIEQQKLAVEYEISRMKGMH